MHDFRCPVCKEELKEVHIGKNPSKALQDLGKAGWKGPRDAKPLGLAVGVESEI